jgi:hypothetical protein
MAQSSLDTSAVVASWLLNFGNALQARDAQTAVDYILPNGWLRESQILVWDNRTLHGRDNIYQHIAKRLPKRSFSNFRVDDRKLLAPERGYVTPGQEGIKSGFLFETVVQLCQGYVQLLQDDDGIWRALVVYMTAIDIKGQEESGRELGIYSGHTISWPTVLGSRRKEAEERPHALISELYSLIPTRQRLKRGYFDIVGAGQTGVMVAARFKQMNIPTLVIEANPRLGDTWRNRYESLILHTPRTHDQCAHQCIIN